MTTWQRVHPKDGKSIPEVFDEAVLYSEESVVTVRLMHRVEWKGTICSGQTFLLTKVERVDQVRQKKVLEGAQKIFSLVGAIPGPIGAMGWGLAAIFDGFLFCWEPDKVGVYMRNGDCDWFEGTVTEEYWFEWEVDSLPGPLPPGAKEYADDWDILLEISQMSKDLTRFYTHKNYSGPMRGGSPVPPGELRRAGEQGG